MARCEIVGEPHYQLTLTKHEAEVLRFVCTQIGGPTSSPRGCMANIAIALDETGMMYPNFEFTGSIYFKDQPQ